MALTPTRRPNVGGPLSMESEAALRPSRSQDPGADPRRYDPSTQLQPHQQRYSPHHPHARPPPPQYTRSPPYPAASAFGQPDPNSPRTHSPAAQNLIQDLAHFNEMQRLKNLNEQIAAGTPVPPSGLSGGRTQPSGPGTYPPALRPSSMVLSGTTIMTPIEPRGVKGASKLLLIACAYRDDTDMYLPSAVADLRAMQQYLTRIGFSPEQRRVLTEDNSEALPTRTAILSAMRWLVRGAVAGDSLFLHFVGHGGKSTPYGTHVDTQLEEAPSLAPLDYKTAGLIYEDEIYDILVGGLAAGAKLTAVLDCVRVGSVMDLPYQLSADAMGFKLTQAPFVGRIPGQVVTLSYASDYGGSNALTTSFIAACNTTPNVTYRQLITEMASIMRKQLGGSAPMPLLCSTRVFEMNDVVTLSALPESQDPLGSSPGYDSREQVLQRRIEKLEEDMHRRIRGQPGQVSARSPGPPGSSPLGPGLRHAGSHFTSPPKYPAGVTTFSEEVLGASKAVVIGVDYQGFPFELVEQPTPSSSARDMQRFLMDIGFHARMQVLTEDSQATQLIPTRANIIAAIKWLVKDVKAGDVLFLYYNGYGSVVPDYEAVSLSDAIAPLDFSHKGFITSDELHSIALRDLPKEAKLIIVCDIAFGGTLITPAYKVSITGDGFLSYSHEAFGAVDDTDADMILLFADGDSELPHAGALTEAVIKVLEDTPQLATGPLLVAMSAVLRASVPGGSCLPAAGGSRKIDERTHFFLGREKQNLKPRRRLPHDPPGVSPTRLPATDPFNQPMNPPPAGNTGPAGIYRVEGSNGPAAVVVDGDRVTLFSTEMGEKRGTLDPEDPNLIHFDVDLASMPTGLDPVDDGGSGGEPPGQVGGAAVYDEDEGVVRFQDGTVWVKIQGPGSGGAKALSDGGDDGPGEAGESVVPAPTADVALEADRGIPKHKRADVILGASKALLVGVSYRGFPQELDAPSRDVQTCMRFLNRQGFNAEFKVLTDDNPPHEQPTRVNIMSGLRWLVRNAVPGDALFFLFSGHGAKGLGISDDGGAYGDETTLAAADSNRTGAISESDLAGTLFSHLPTGVKLTVVLDIDNCGCVLDLPFHLSALASGGFATKECASDLNSDVTVFYLGNGAPKSNGALATAFMTVLNQAPSIALEELLINMRAIVRQRLGGDSCNVAMSSTRRLHPSDPVSLGTQQPQPPAFAGGEFSAAGTDGRCRALLIAVGYSGKLPHVNAALYDVQALLVQHHYEPACMRVLQESNPQALPSKGNILASMRWLVHGAEPGDNLFFYFTGYGGKPTETALPPDQQGIAPMDWATYGAVTGSEMFDAMVAHLPAGANLVGLLDCVYTCSPCSLPFVLTSEGDGGTTYTHVPSPEVPGKAAFVTTTPDTRNPALAPLNGVLTSAFIAAVAGYGRPPNYAQFMHALRTTMNAQVRSSGHVPRLLSSRRFSENDVFAISLGAAPPKGAPQLPPPPPQGEPERTTGRGMGYPGSGHPSVPRRNGGLPLQLMPPPGPYAPYRPPRGPPVSMHDIGDSVKDIMDTVHGALNMVKHRSPPKQRGAMPMPMPMTPPPASPLSDRTLEPPDAGEVPTYVRRLRLGEPSEPLGMRVDPSRDGMVVASVVPGGPASLGGVVPGDIIRSIGSYPIRTTTDIRNARMLATQRGLVDIPVGVHASVYL
ncbi:Metacaspase-1 [Diplonema papillatum]|nr:Metacaspase-1 [Diplonema papillatum]